MKQLPPRLFLFFLPVVYLILSVSLLIAWNSFYISRPDPAYAYLLNGVNLAGGHMEIGHTDHPGTPVQCFAAIVIFIKHLFANNIPVYQDVLLNPESYLYAISITFVLLLTVITYLTGAYIFRNTANIKLAILFQLSPLLISNLLPRTLAVCPESLIIIVGQFFMAYIYIAFFKRANSESFNMKNIISFGLLSGFLIACKIICAPIIFLFLFLLEKTKQRLIYLGTLIIGFFIFIIPAIPKLGNMYHWVISLATHEGYYGTGKVQILNPAHFATNFVGIFLTDFTLTAIYLFISIAFVATIINFFEKKKIDRNGRLIVGIWLSITTLILMVAKHCEFYYMIPAEITFPLGLIISYKILSERFDSETLKKVNKPIIYASVIILICITFLVLKGTIPTGTHFTFAHFASAIKHLNFSYLSSLVTHFNFHYPVPPLITFPLGFVFLYKILSSVRQSDIYHKNKKIPIFIFAGTLFVFLLIQNISSISSEGEFQKQSITTRKFIKSHNSIPRIIVRQGASSGSSIEHALYLGISYSGNMYNTYCHFIEKYYPNSYLYETNSKILHHWGDTITNNQVFTRHDSVLVYFVRVEEQTETGILHNLCTTNDTTTIGKYQKIFTNQATSEDIFLIEPDKAFVTKLLSYNPAIYNRSVQLASTQ